MFREKTQFFLLRISGILLGAMLLLCACSVATTTLQPQATLTAPTPTVAVVVPTSTPTQAPAITGQGITIDLNGLAQSFSSQVIAAVPAGTDKPYWQVMPQYTVLTFTGYPIANHLVKPQVFIYPVKDLAAANEGAGQIAASLQTLLQNQQAGKNLPYLPLYNAAQMLHAQVKYQDFKNGKGLRYLTQFTQGLVLVNNQELIYTYQGLTRDGKYYLAVVLPVSLSSLPADEKVTGQEPPEFRSDYPKYLNQVVGTLNQQTVSAFAPDLSKLDALIQSIEIK